MTSTLEAIVREEVEALHRFFVGWFSGSVPMDSFDREFLSRFDSQFLLVPPAGELLSLGNLESGVRKAYGSNPDFRIEIRNVKLRRVLSNEVLATYEEWQRNALASKPRDNARIATVLFQKKEPLRWLHIHETWMPERIASAGPYDF